MTQVTTETITKTFQTIQTQLKNDEWVKSQDANLIESLHTITEVIEALSQQIFIFIDCFEQYAKTLEGNIRVPAFDIPSNSDV